MNKTGWFFASFAAWIMAFVFLGATPSTPQAPPVTPIVPPIIVPPVTPPVIPPIVEPDLIGVQVPIAKANRIYNKSGSQCVWVSIETLARHHGIKEIYEGENRISKHYTWATGPGEVSRVLKSKYPTVQWKHIQSRSQLKDFVKKYVTEEKLGVGLAIPGHMLTLVHYDEAAKIVKVIDNGGPKALQVQEWTMERFERISDGWALVLIPPGRIVRDSFDCTIREPHKIYGLKHGGLVMEP
jgi:hypothetical protein